MSQIILASASPRRRELLEQVGLEFSVCPAKGEEHIADTEPARAVEELSRQKAQEVAAGLISYGMRHRELVSRQEFLVIGADTVVASGGRILGKPGDEEEAASMLRSLSGGVHSVYTGVALVFIDGERTGEHVFFERTDVSLYELSEEEIARYVASGEPMDKAGAYGIQGRFAIHVKEIRGDYSNVVGLPVARLYQELMRLGYDPYRAGDP